MKSSALKMFVFVFAGILLASCSSIRVTSDSDSSVDFSQFETYEYFGWAKESDKRLNDLDKKRLEQAFGKELAKRGLKYVESGGDLVISLFILVDEKTETQATTTYSGGGGYYGGYYGRGPGWGWGTGYSSTNISEYDYKEGTLVIDVFDADEKRLIWEGTGIGTIKEDPAHREKNIPKAVAKIMEKYPVQPMGE